MSLSDMHPFVVSDLMLEVAQPMKSSDTNVTPLFDSVPSFSPVFLLSSFNSQLNVPNYTKRLPVLIRRHAEIQIYTRIMPSRMKLSRLFKSISINDKKTDEILNGSHFLAMIPPEIRILIYQELISNYIVSNDPRSGRIRLAEEHFNETTRSITVLTKSSAESLPLVCRQVSREYSSVLAVTVPKKLCFRESKRAAKDRAMSLSLANIKQHLREPTSNAKFDRVETLVIGHKLLVTLLRPIEERFFSSLKRIELTGAPKDPAEVKARYQSLVFRGYEKLEEESTEDIWVFEYNVESNEFEFHRKMSFVRLGLASGQMSATQAAHAMRSISNARIAETQPVAY